MVAGAARSCVQESVVNGSQNEIFSETGHPEPEVPVKLSFGVDEQD